MTSPVVVPHCYRHGDRETYISCQRCGRPICPDCMRQASVGFHCPECVAEAARTVRPARTMAGGLLPGRVGIASMTLIGINVVVFFVIVASGGTESELYLRGVLIGGPFPERFGIDGVADGAYWRMVTAAFIHLQVLHLLFNMYALAIFGPMLEQLLGHLRFIALYVLGALVSSLVVYWLSPESPTIGASGAIFALFGAAIVLMLRRGQDVSNLLVLLAINIFISFVVPNISWQGHFGGLGAGLLVGFLFGYAPRQRRTTVHSVALGLMFVAIVIATLARTASLTG